MVLLGLEMIFKINFAVVFFCLFWLLCAACRILVPILGIKPAPSAVEAQSLNHWSAKGSP